MKNKIIQITLLVLVLIITIESIQSDVFYNNNFKNTPISKIKKSPFYIFLSSISGFKVLVADFLWMDIVQYLGDKTKAEERYKELYPKVVDLINIDPNFTYAYLAVSGMLLFELNETDKAIELVQTGIKNNPKYWQLSLYLAAYTYSKAGNIRMAVNNIETAVIQEDHPPLLERMLSSMYLKLAENEKERNFWMKKAVNLWLYMYSESKDKVSRQYAKDRLEKLGLLK